MSKLPFSDGPEGRAPSPVRREKARPSGPSRNGTAALLLYLVAATAAPTTRPSDPQLWAEMRQVDAAAGRAEAVRADFRQEKFTPLMKRPLVSTGTIVGRGPVSLWVTDAPRPSAMRVTADRIRIYYPDQKVVESYPVQGNLGALAASPLPRLDVLTKFFAFDRLPATEAGTLDLRLTPTTDELRQHVREVRVALDRATGAIRRTETVDGDGDRTVLIFAHVDLHARVADADLDLHFPPDTRQVEPLAGVAPAGGQ